MKALMTDRGHSPAEGWVFHSVVKEQDHYVLTMKKRAE
jgi:hypothetical protein